MACPECKAAQDCEAALARSREVMKTVDAGEYSEEAVLEIADAFCELDQKLLEISLRELDPRTGAESEIDDD